MAVTGGKIQKMRMCIIDKMSIINKTKMCHLIFVSVYVRAEVRFENLWLRLHIFSAFQLKPDKSDLSDLFLLLIFGMEQTVVLIRKKQ